MHKILITPETCRAGRALIGLSQRELAEKARISKQTLVDFERGARTPYENNLLAIQAALEEAGVVFLTKNGNGPGVRLKA